MSVYEKDNPEYLQLAIDSMLNQSVRPSQFVLVIDGKIGQELQRVIDNYDVAEDIFSVVRLEKNSGLANALNIGLEHCSNNLVARMDADDISLPDRCEKELSYFEKYDDLAVCGCNIDEFYDDIHDIRTSRVVPGEYENIVRFSHKRQPFNHPTVIFKKDIVLKVGGYPELRRKEDFDLFSRIIASGAYVRNVDESLYLYRANENNYLRRKSKENMKAALQVYKLHRRRGGCGLIDYIVICSAEIMFYIMPKGLMRIVSDKLLRK